MQTPAVQSATKDPSHPPMNHSGRLIYANPRDLPSFPSVGVKDNGAASSAAASLGWANQKSFQHWTPGATPSSASTAALLANDYKTAPGWQPERSADGAKAALLAAGSAGKSETRPSTAPAPSAWGNTAATAAFKIRPAQVSTEIPALDRQRSMKAAKSAHKAADVATPAESTAPLDRQRSMRAAKLAHQAAGARPRAQSNPVAQHHIYPDRNNATANALRAATSAHRRQKPSIDETGGAVPYTNLPRSMFTSHPPVQPEVDEQRRSDVLHASAVAMAKRMYTQQQKMADAAKQAHGEAGARSSISSDGTQPMPFVNLQEAAYKLAQERLAKLHEEHQKNRDYQDYYVQSNEPQRRSTIRARLRRRASSDGDVSDRQRSEKIRQQMSLFSTKINEVDEKKRQKDRDAVMAAAQRNVKARMEGMDKKMYEETGRINPSVYNDWESKAHSVAQIRSEGRRNSNAGKIDIGGGKFMTQEEVNEIAAKRVQPALDEINEKAEKERERLAVLRMEEEARKEKAETEKARQKEIDDIHQKLKHEQKEQDKARKEEAKLEERARKEAEKAARQQQKEELKQEEQAKKEAERNAKAERQKRQNKEEQTAKGKEPAGDDNDVAVHEEVEDDDQQRPRLQMKATDISFGGKDKDKKPKSPSSSDETSPTSKVRGWFKSRFSRPRAKSSNETGKRTGFIGGAALMHTDGTGSMTSLEHHRTSSMREVALAGKTHSLQPTPRPAVGPKHVAATEKEGGGEGSAGLAPDAHQQEQFGGKRSRDSVVSSISSVASDDVIEGGSRVSSSFAPPRAIRDSQRRVSSSPARDSRFLEDLEDLE